MKHILLRLIHYYQQVVSPLLSPRCRFYPTCSEYTKESITNHGAFRGLWLGLKRLSKCHPFHPGGVDPSPQMTQEKKEVHNG
ncbi:MAG: membrane protein insertion efficiency factor YidD [Proteobacteria bacterium]|nr:membrane protein insertion efficiency factor YidD [Pseudomonadota bacterium]MDA0862079.1 membrane protein insertion efficiency factor YidD [Pseudomonadota bacterium]MDA1030119.1 membrane protein insertion efficiency factor YidD [Pseudomonadota bacterium]